VPDELISLENVLKLFGDDYLTFEGQGDASQTLTVTSSGQHWPISRLVGKSDYVREMFRTKRAEIRDSGYDSSSGLSVSFRKLVEQPTARARFRPVCSAFYNNLVRELRDAEEYVAHIEGQKAVFQF
jgi:hypothetical protein